MIRAVLPSPGLDVSPLRPEAIFRDIVLRVPESRLAPASDVTSRWRDLASAAASEIAAQADTVPLPRAWADLESCAEILRAAWRRQTRLVADLFAVAGRSSLLTEQVLAYCMARHAAMTLVRDLVTREDARTVLHRLSDEVWSLRLDRIARKVCHRLHGAAQARILPTIACTGLPGLLYLETCAVGATTTELLLDRRLVAARASRSTR